VCAALLLQEEEYSICHTSTPIIVVVVIYILLHGKGDASCERKDKGLSLKLDSQKGRNWGAGGLNGAGKAPEVEANGTGDLRR
jgi:hypothetical protein